MAIRSLWAKTAVGSESPCSSSRSVASRSPSSRIGREPWPRASTSSDAGVLAGVAEALVAGDEVADVHRAAQLGEAGVAELDQVSRRQRPARPVVVEHVRERAARDAADGDHHRREAGRRLEDVAVAEAGAGDDDRVDPAAEQAVHSPLQLLGVVLGLEDQREHLLGGEGLGDAVDHRGDERVGQVGDDHPDGRRRPPAQRPGDVVAAVAEVLRRLAHAGDRLLLDEVGLGRVEGAGHRRGVDTDALGDVLEGHVGDGNLLSPIKALIFAPDLPRCRGGKRPSCPCPPHRARRRMPPSSRRGSSRPAAARAPTSDAERQGEAEVLDHEVDRHRHRRRLRVLEHRPPVVHDRRCHR